jgi:nicotinate-nucleotide pyrophosphorylase (carboxylating)
MTVMSGQSLDPALYREIVRRAIAEDLGWGDVTTDATVPSDTRARGRLLAHSQLVLAGLPIAIETFRQLDPGIGVTEHRHDGDRCSPGEAIADLTGAAPSILTAERTALNFLQRLSGIATLTRLFVDAAAGRMIVLDTRKTTPTLRALEKYAVLVGGGASHRSALDSAILIKDNHVRLAGGVREALARARAAADPELVVEIEVQDLQQLEEALETGGAAWIMLDNMSVADVREAVRRTGKRAKLEVSGGVTLARMPELAATGADAVSIGALTHSAPAADISLELEPGS